MPTLLERLGVELPVVQAGMGGGLSRHELAAAVSEAGGLGTIAVNGAGAIRRELAAARALTGRPLAVNVLLPFARGEWFEAAAEADVVVTFWGRPRRHVGGVWLHQCGSAAEAWRAWSAGADGVIVQGVEAGGHVRGRRPALELLEEVRAALPPTYPVLLAGGIATRADAREALEAGADAAVAGTRFLLSAESRAHPAYKQRLLAAEETVLTELFGAGWPAAPHRVVPNAATERWLGGARPSFVPHSGANDGGVSGEAAPRPLRPPLANRALNRLLALGTRRVPDSLQARMIRAQRPGSRLLTPAGPTDDGPATLVEAGALYAGQTVARIGALRPAAELVRELGG
ncbi:MAG: NAD(P)H-dependent flavin oxidoreductase [Solirubrobacterales bacterium]